MAKRARDYGKSLKKKRWSAIAYDLSDLEGVNPSVVREWQDVARRTGAAVDTVEWRLLRIQQCGAIAMVVDSEIWRDRLGPEQRNHLSISAMSWVWKESDWYMTAEPEKYVPGSALRKILGNENGTRFWLTDPEEDFTEVWVAPKEANIVPGDDGRPPLNRDLLDSGEPRLTREPVTAESKKILRETAARYATAIMEHRENDVREAWGPRPLGTASVWDETFHSVWAEAAGGKVDSFRISSVEVMEYMSKDPNRFAFAVESGVDLNSLTHTVAKVRIVFTIQPPGGAMKNVISTESYWLFLGFLDPVKWSRGLESEFKDDRLSATWDDLKRKWRSNPEPLEESGNGATARAPITAPSVLEVPLWLSPAASDSEESKRVGADCSAGDERLLHNLCAYTEAVAQGRDNDVLAFWEASARRRPELSDDAIRAVRASGRTVESFSINRLQILEGMARVEVEFVLTQDPAAETSSKLRVETFWIRRAADWYRVIVTPAGWDPEKARDCGMRACFPGIRRILVREPSR